MKTKIFYVIFCATAAWIFWGLSGVLLTHQFPVTEAGARILMWYWIVRGVLPMPKSPAHPSPSAPSAIAPPASPPPQGPD